MKIKVTRFASLRKTQDQEAEVVTLPGSATVKDLLQNLMINVSDVGVLVVNTRNATFDQALLDGDNVTIIPPIGGG